MQYELLKYLRCPLTKTELKFQLIKEFEKNYSDSSVQEICDGILFSETGFVFPVINGIPRMLIESFYDCADFLKEHLPDYKLVRSNLELKHQSLISYCLAKNKRTKESFEFEWSFLRPHRNDKVWHKDISEMTDVFLAESNEEAENFRERTVIDVGCGHGLMTSRIGEISALAVGVELSKAVEDAYLNNRCKKAWYIQGDLQFLPFDDGVFDVLYCSGVIHHTNNTELSLLLIEALLKKGGRICLWLYHPQKSKIHNAFLSLRNVTKKLPLKAKFYMLSLFVFPLSYFFKKIKKKKSINHREEIIDLLDHFTPEFRYEIPHDLAKSWLKRKKYTNIKVTTEDQFGFSIVGDKS